MIARVTPRTDRAALYIALMRLGRSVQRWRWWDEKAESWVETDSADFGDAIADRCDGILAEREAAAPDSTRTEALRAIANLAHLAWEDRANVPTVFRMIEERARAALASPEPTPDSGLDVERLAEAIRNAYIAPSASRDMDAENIVREYARLSPADSPEEES